MNDLPNSEAEKNAFEAMPRGDEISRQLRQMIELSGDFERRLGHTLGVGPTDLSAMQHLMVSGPLPPSELARRLLISTAAATMMVDRLENLGHASRHPHPDDRRKIVVTPARESVDRAAAELMPLIRGVAEVTARLSEEDAATVTRFLGDVLEVYRDVLGEEQ
ncbi:MarR family winged helix-turn-helix transcriptional regulator [Herbiconiux sp. L3-i23]|uniref:MarR family winged helix-turn-helix transcriptional regulator n=1 Tax=Herbiconiux sp. L3-i23 TaxID=2905871 RepID=UPI00205EC3B8|nr:MarR family transcriptional regulator [Herbiconiux sp. L3-i23]BDI22651.1 MarR family transcriptional regulator [Herbiconiux sp. L3-i23]